MTDCSSQRGQYDRMEKAMFDYMDAVSDDFFHEVTVGEMNEARDYFAQVTHEKIHAAFATALVHICRGMGGNH